MGAAALAEMYDASRPISLWAACAALVCSASVAAGHRVLHGRGRLPALLREPPWGPLVAVMVSIAMFAIDLRPDVPVRAVDQPGILGSAGAWRAGGHCGLWRGARWETGLTSPIEGLPAASHRNAPRPRQRMERGRLYPDGTV